MKKFACLILTIVCAVSFALFFSACTPNENEESAGLKVRNIDGVYTVVGYASEKTLTGEDVTELNIAEYNGQSIGAIKTGAFKGNTTLTKITVADSVKEIGEGAFANMTKLEELTIPFSGRKIVAYDNERLFGYVFGTTEYVGGYSVTQNYNDQSNVTVYIPETLSKVTIKNSFSAYAQDSEPITNYNVPKYAFNNVLSLEQITLDINTKEICDFAFSGCSGLKSFDLPNSVETIGKNAFYMCSNVNGDMNLTGNADADFTYSANTNLNKISEKAFYGTNLKNVIIPDSVTEIGEFAFASETDDNGTITTYGASKVENVVFGEKVKNVGKYAFFRCENLVNVLFNDEIENIYEGAFYKCVKLNEVDFPASVLTDLTIKSSAFYGCTELKILHLPSNPLTIGADAFNSCVKLSGVTISSASTLSERAFANCAISTSINGADSSVYEGSPIGVTFTDIDANTCAVSAYNKVFDNFAMVIPAEYNGKQVVKINANVFDSKDIVSVKLPDTIIEVGNEAFKNSAVEDVTFGNNIEKVGKNVVSGTPYATDANYEGNVLYVGKYALSYKAVNALTEIVIKEGTILIANNAFENASTINKITINKDVKFIGDNAFSGCMIETVVIDSEDVAKNLSGLNAMGGLISGTTIILIKANVYNVNEFISLAYGSAGIENGYYKYQK